MCTPPSTPPEGVITGATAMSDEELAVFVAPAADVARDPSLVDIPAQDCGA